MLAKAQTETLIWKDDMNYQSFDQLQAAGWTSEHAAGVSFGSVGVILDQTSGDTAIHYIGHFSSGIYNWKVEDSSRWVSGDHCGNDISALTEKHSYAFSADGWYSNFAFYHDGSKVYTTAKGTFSESQGNTFTLSMIKIDNKINCYYNGELKYTYTESDSAPSQLNGVDAVSPWLGSSEYDYFELSSVSGSFTPTSENVFSNPVVIGGAIGGVGIGVGVAVYYFVVAGGSSAAGSASAGSGVAGAANGAGGSGSSGSGGGSGGTNGGGISGDGDLVDSNLIADASQTQETATTAVDLKPPPNFNITSNNPAQSSVQAQSQLNDYNQAQTIQQTMQQNNQQTHQQLQQQQSNTQTSVFQIQQDVTSNKAKTQDKSFQNWDQTIRASNDPDAVADSGSGSGGSDA
jgi:hypothetical protein